MRGIICCMAVCSLLAATGIRAQELSAGMGGRRDSIALSLPEFKINPSATTTDMTLPPLNTYESIRSDALANIEPANRHFLPPSLRFRLNRNPAAYDFSEAGAVTAWDTGYAFGSSSRTTMPGLLTQQNAEIGLTQTFGRLTVTAGLSADRYQLWRSVRTQFGVNGRISYQIDERLSFNVFGAYYDNTPYVSPATLPYFSTSNFGATLDMLFSDRFGLEAGAQSVYDPYARRWMAVPVVSPYVRLNNGRKIGVDVGYFIGEIIDNAFNGGRYYNQHNPTIGPPVPPMPPVR